MRERQACAAMAEVMTPDAILRSVACGRGNRKHGRWHANRGVRWRGRYKAPVYPLRNPVGEEEG